MSKKILAVVLALVMVFSVMLPMTVATAATGNWGEISYEVIDGMVYITATTDASYNRLALFYADDTSLAACLETTNAYVEDGDNRVWTLKIPVEYVIPGSEFELAKPFIIRGRDAETNTYKAGGISDSFEIAPEWSILSYGIETRGDKVVVTVETNSYINKVKVSSLATGAVLGYDGTVTVEDYGDGDVYYYWTVTFPYDENDTEFVIQARDSRTGKYNKKDIIEDSVWQPAFEPITSAEIVELEDGENLLVRVKTSEYAWFYRIKIAYADNAKGAIAYTGEPADYDENWNPIYEMVIPRPEATTEYAIDVAYDERAYEKYYTYVEYVVESAECTHENTTTTTVDATCGADGLETVACADCGEIISETVLPATGAHVYAWEITTMPAVGVAGEKAGTCACGATTTEAIAALTAPNADAAANAVEGGWYMTTDGMVQLYVSDWSYYGSYGLTLVKNPLAYPTSAATIAVYAADADDVFAAKTAADFEAVLGETVNSFEAVTVAGQYPGYIAHTATYCNLVFQANGAKYFINYINGGDGTDIETEFAIMAANVVVYAPCTHEATTTTTVDATCTEVGSITVTCDDCGEVVSAEEIPATGHENTTEVTVQDATCTEAGWVNVVCDACGEIVGGYEIPANGHGETTTNVTTEPTCGAEGNEQIVCNDCGTVLEENTIPATGEHAYTSEITTIPAIDVEGEKTYTCGVCGDTYTEVMAALAAPNAPVANTVDNTWYTTTDGLVQLYVADWMYYGSYGLTLVKSASVPTSAATIAVYAADSDEVFAAKTADDFAAVLQEEVTSFEAVTVAGQYPGYIAYTASYRNLVFQANGAKYFINVIAIEGEVEACEELFAIMAANVVVYTPCTHENTTATTVDATCGEAGSITTTCDDCGEVVSVEEIAPTGEHTYVVEITTIPAIDVAGEKTYTCSVCGDTYTEAMAALTAPTSAEANTVADTWYTTNDGLVQLYVADWMYYGSYGLTLVKSGSIPTSAATIAVYAADSDEVFAAKTQADFESVLQETINEFYAVTIAGQYPGYVAYSASYRNLVFQANGAKYFINIIGIEGEQDACEELFQIMMANVIVNEPAVCEHANTTVVETVAGTYNTKGTGDIVCDDCGEVVEAGVATTYVAPAEELWNTVTEDGWYVYADGKAAMNVGSWVYYGQYGLTLVGAADVVPIDAATVAIYTADSDEVFAAKTADDFASVLQEEVTSFEAVEICGYPGYIAKTASYRNLVFQANGYKYFINYMVVDGDAANVDSEADFAVAVDSLIVY